MRWTVGMIAVGLAGCGGSAGDVAAILALEGDEANGGEIYSANCAACHGDEGEGGTSLALNGSALPTEDVILTILDGRGSMTGFRELLTDQDVADLWAHMQAAILE